MGKVWFDKDFSGDSRVLFVALAGKIFVEGKWEWANTWTGLYTDLDFKRMHLVDQNISWWQTSFPGIEGHGPLALKGFMQEQIKEANVDYVVFMGLSMGGYGSILMGCLTEADEVIAFSPQTFLSQGRRKKAQLNKKFEPYNIDERMTDLKNVLEDYGNDKTIYHIYYGKLNPTDVHHAERLSHIKNVVLHPVNSDRHTVARILVDDGTVGRVMKRICDSVDNNKR